MNLSQLKPKKGSAKRRKIVARGYGSGHGLKAGRGGKGQTARSGGTLRPGFEGGQMPLVRRLPKRGFSNKSFATVYSIINLEKISEAGLTEVTPDSLFGLGMVKKGVLLKILGSGDLKKPVTISAHKFSEGARKKIESAGGKITILT